MIPVDETGFEQEVLKAEVLVVLDFGATWCRPCKKLDPIMEELAQQYEGKAKIRKVDVGVARGIAEKYRVLSVPQILFFKNGNVVEHFIGLVSKAKLVESFEKHL